MVRHVLLNSFHLLTVLHDIYLSDLNSSNFAADAMQEDKLDGIALKPEGKSKVRMLQDCNKEQVIQQMLEFYQKMMSNLVGFLTKLHLCCPKLAC